MAKSASHHFLTAHSSEDEGSSKSSLKSSSAAVLNTVLTHYYDEIPPDSHQLDRDYSYVITKKFYEEDEFCRKNPDTGRLEFGIVSRYLNESKRNLKIFWTLPSGIQEQDIDLTRPHFYEHLRLTDRKVDPGDIIQVNQKSGEVMDVCWTCDVRIQENGMHLVDIPCGRLEPFVQCFTGQRIELDGWIGTVTNVGTGASLLFSKGHMGQLNCSSVPTDLLIYPGQTIRLTPDQYKAAGLETLEGTPFSDVFKGDNPIEAFVMFVNVLHVDVKWIGKISASCSTCSLSISEEDMPPSTLSRSKLKNDANFLGTFKDINWENFPDAVDKLYNCAVHPTDVVIQTSIEEHMHKRYFSLEEEDEEPGVGTAIQHSPLTKSPSRIMTNVSHVVKLLRFSRMIRVKWSNSGKIEMIRASKVTSRHSFEQPFRQIVQKKVSLAPFSYDMYGVTLSRDTNEMVAVEWISRDPSVEAPPFLHSTSSTSMILSLFPTKYLTMESALSLQPHFAYGQLSVSDVVFRSTECRLPESLFSIGWIRSVTKQGQLVVISMDTKQEHFLYPSEVERTGIKLHGSTSFEEEQNNNSQPSPNDPNSLLEIHDISILRAADEFFSRNLDRQRNLEGVVIPFTNQYTVLPKVHTSHSFYSAVPSILPEHKTWRRAVKDDQLYLSTSANNDFGSIWVKGFQNRSDLYSVLMAAPPGTLYDGAVFEFDIQLPEKYPLAPPSVFLLTVLSPGASHYRIRPGLQSLELRDTLIPPYTLVEFLFALQCQAFSHDSPCPPPSAGGTFERKEPQSEHERRVTNAEIIIDVLDLMFRMVMDPPVLWSNEVIIHFHLTFQQTAKRLNELIQSEASDDVEIPPSFPLFPVSDGFVEAVKERLKRFQELMVPMPMGTGSILTIYENDEM